MSDDRGSEAMTLVKEGKSLTFIGGEKPDREKLGGTYSKKRLAGEIKLTPESSRSREINMVTKFVGHSFDSAFSGPLIEGEGCDMSPAERYLARWKYLRSHGIPTVGSMRVVDGNKVAMGDMTANGGEFFGKEKGMQLEWELRDGVIRKLTETEQAFLKIDKKELKTELDRLVDDAWEKGIRLPWDDPFEVLVRDDGSYQLMILDLGYLTKRRDGDTLKDRENDKSKAKTRLDNIYLKLMRIDADGDGGPV